MSPIKERAKELIDQLSDEAVAELIEDMEDSLELKRAIAQEGNAPGAPLDEFLKELRREGKLA